VIEATTTPLWTLQLVHVDYLSTGRFLERNIALVSVTQLRLPWLRRTTNYQFACPAPRIPANDLLRRAVGLDGQAELTFLFWLARRGQRSRFR